jgi:hypothetical protein
MRYLYFFLFSCCFGYSQIGINNPTPNASAELDIKSTSKGVLIPRLTQAERLVIASPAQGLLVYQTDTVGGNLFGFYYYQLGWFPLYTVDGWGLLGKTGANASTNYIGTTDAVPFTLRTNGFNRMRILGDGKVGINTISPTIDLQINSTTADALRIDDGFQAAGSILASTANGTTIWKSAVDLGLVAWYTTGNTGTKPPANSLGTIDTADLSVRTGGVEAMVIQGSGLPAFQGNVRINETAPTQSQLFVKNSTSGGAVIKGKNTATTTGISFGVIGQTACLELGSYSVRGTCLTSLGTQTTGNGGGIGVLGKYTLSGAAVFGRAYYTSTNTINTLYNYDVANYVDFIAGRDYGVYGLANYTDNSTNSSVGVYGKNTNTSGSAPSGSFGMYSEGNFAVGGGGTCTICTAGGTLLKSASVPTTKGNQLVYCKESPEMWFEDFGSGQLQNGTAHIAMDPLFLETVFIDNGHKMHVVLQEQAESKGLYYTVDADHKGFTVKEKKGGNANITFSYSIMAKRRFYQDQRFGVDSLQPFEDNLSKAKAPILLTTDPIVMKLALEKGVAEKERLFKEQKEKEDEQSQKKEASKTSN